MWNNVPTCRWAIQTAVGDRARLAIVQTPNLAREPARPICDSLVTMPRPLGTWAVQRVDEAVPEALFGNRILSVAIYRNLSSGAAYIGEEFVNVSFSDPL